MKKIRAKKVIKAKKKVEEKILSHNVNKEDSLLNKKYTPLELLELLNPIIGVKYIAMDCSGMWHMATNKLLKMEVTKGWYSPFGIIPVKSGLIDKVQSWEKSLTEL